jgi:hypothetical protein
VVDRKKYVSWTIFGLQQCSRQVVLVALADFVLGGALELRVLGSSVKTLGNLWWLYLAMMAAQSVLC